MTATGASEVGPADPKFRPRRAAARNGRRPEGTLSEPAVDDNVGVCGGRYDDWLDPKRPTRGRLLPRPADLLVAGAGNIDIVEIAEAPWATTNVLVH
jgi:hypothetical protein